LDSRQLASGRLVEFWDGGDPAGSPLVMHTGTPDPRESGRLSHRHAVAAGIRLICINRPGYGGTTVAAPSLAQVGRDTAALATELGLDGYAVVGVSGGGPYAVATATADQDRVQAVGVVAGIGPWRLLNARPSDPGEDMWAVDRELLALADAGDFEGALAGFVAEAAKEFGPLADMDEHAQVIAFFGGTDGPRFQDPEFCDVVIDEIRVVLDSYAGYAFDNLAWGGPWDVDPREVRAPTTLWYGTADDICPPTHGAWLAERIERSELRLMPDENHVQVCMGHQPEVFSTLVKNGSEDG
jgi:pimeloyl-ACP methyl ester carboxylesterase